MANTIPYNTSSDALLHPAKNAVFFKGWVPEVDNRNHDLLCAEMSRLAYAPQEVIRGSLESIGFTALEHIGGEDLKERSHLRGTQGFVARHPSLKLTVLAFRGTESDKLEDLLSDIETLQREWPDSPGCLAHDGFADCWFPAKDEVCSLVAQREGALLVTGHSLGAALATLAAIVVKPTKLITFGSPRVGNDKLCALLDEVEVRRFVHCCDMVTRIPPEQFDQENLGQFLTELADPHNILERSLLRGAASALALAFRGLSLDPHFKHVTFARYADRNGRILGDVTDEVRRQDQEAARRAYGHPASHESFGQLGERLRELTARVTAAHGDALEAFRSFTGHLFASNGSSVALRDLADHAPINYVSLFTGR